jgi:hypothetical protein
MSVHRVLLFIVSAQLVPAAMGGDAVMALQRSDTLMTGANAHHLIVTIGGRKGTRNYSADDSGAATDLKDADSSSKTEARKGRLDNCMASWDSKTHIPKSNWRKICERQLSDE